MNAADTAITVVRVAAAILIMVGVRSLAAREHELIGRCPGSLVAGATLWILSELAATPLVRSVLATAPHWFGVALLAASVSFAAALIGTLAVVTRISCRSGADTGAASTPTQSSHRPPSELLRDQASSGGAPS